jgi:Transposase DDE domain
MEKTRIDDHWPHILGELPADFDLDETARACGAFTRRRGVKSPEDLLRLALAYGGCGMSLRETCCWAAETGVAELADPSLLNRLRKADGWLAELLGAVLAQRMRLPRVKIPGRRLRAIDATTLCEPGADRTTWRLHVSYDLMSGQVDHVELTDIHGGESLNRFSFRPGDIGLADRGYARPRDLRPVIEAGADPLVRIGWNSLRLLTPGGDPFDLFDKLRRMKRKSAEATVRVDERVAGAAPLLLRLVIWRKSKKQAATARDDLIKEAKKRGKTPDAKSLEAAGYVLLLTSLPADEFPAAKVARLYRLRWQIELAFKRFKSLAGLDQLAAKDPALARSWIYGKLLVAILAERIAGLVPESPPWGLETRTDHAVPLARDEDRPRSAARRHSRSTTLDRRTKLLPQTHSLSPRSATQAS